MNPHAGSATSLRLGDFEIDRASRALRRQGRPVPLGSRALDLLWALVAARGDLVTKDELLRQVWPGLVVEEANVQVQVSALRKALGADAIATVPSLGYRIAWPVTEGGASAVRHNLEAERTPFVGRAAAVADAQARLAGGVLLTLIGIGGCGKTRLARHLAELELERFEDGVWWVDLARLDRAEQLVPAVAQAVACPLNGHGTPLGALARALQPRQMLLVLDNCEHLVEPVCSLLDTLLDGAPGLRVMVTSREALGLRGEMIVPVKPLDTPPPGATPEQVWSSDAARLFLQAAELACPTLPMADDVAATVGAICRQLDGIPLALELAASQLKVVAPGQLVGILERRFRLQMGHRRALPRQQTLRAVIGWSVDSLDADAKALLLALSACAGGCDIDAVRALAGDGADEATLLALVARLVDRSLVSVSHDHGVARYSLLETVRQFASETLHMGGQHAAVLDRHADHYGRLAQRAAAVLGGAERLASLQQLDREHDNIVRALDWAIESRQWATGSRTIGAMLHYWLARGLLHLGHDTVHAMLATADPHAPDNLLAGLKLDAARLALRLGQRDAARALADAAAAHAQRAPAPAAALALDATILRAQCDMREHRVQQACADLALALETARAAELWPQEAEILEALGEAHARAADLAAARDCFEASLVIDRRHGRRERVVTQLLNLGYIAVRAGSAGAARSLAAQIVPELALASHHFHACLLLDLAACLAAVEQDWAACLHGHVAASRHFAAAGYVESAQRRERREADEARAHAQLAPDAARAITALAATASLAQELARVAAWLNVAAPH